MTRIYYPSARKIHVQMHIYPLVTLVIGCLMGVVIDLVFGLSGLFWTVFIAQLIGTLLRNFFIAGLRGEKLAIKITPTGISGPIVMGRDMPIPYNEIDYQRSRRRGSVIYSIRGDIIRFEESLFKSEDVREIWKTVRDKLGKELHSRRVYYPFPRKFFLQACLYPTLGIVVGISIAALIGIARGREPLDVNWYILIFYPLCWIVALMLRDGFRGEKLAIKILDGSISGRGLWGWNELIKLDEIDHEKTRRKKDIYNKGGNRIRFAYNLFETEDVREISKAIYQFAPKKRN